MATEGKVPWRRVLLVTALAIGPYLNAVRADFTLDDLPNVCHNAAVTGGLDVTRIFAAPMPLLEYLYRPFSVLTFALNEALTPGNAAAFHIVNVALHAIVTLLVFWLAIHLFDAQVATTAASLFAIHPIHTEAVTSIVGRAELLAALFGLIALLSAAAMDRGMVRRRKLVLYTVSVASFALALLSKESAITVLALILLLRVTCRREPVLAGLWREMRSLDWIPYAFCIAVFMTLRLAVVRAVALPTDKLTPLDNALAFVPWTVRFRSAVGVLWDYFGLLNVPVVLSADYSYNQVPLAASWIDPRFLAGVALLAAATWLMIRHRHPSVRFAVAIPFVALLLTANLVVPIGTIKAERLLYLPSVGWVLLVAWSCDCLLRIQRYRPIAVGTLAVMVAAFSLRTWTRNWDWKDNRTLFESMVRSAPNSAKAHYNLGVALQESGATAAAVAEFHTALTISPWTEGAALGIGIDFERKGHVSEAIAWYRKALEIEPGYGDAHTNLCHVLFTGAQHAAAAAACRNGLRYNPADANLLKGLGAGLVALGETDKGIEVLRRSLTLNADDHELRIYIAHLEGTATAHAGRTVTVQ